MLGIIPYSWLIRIEGCKRISPHIDIPSRSAPQTYLSLGNHTKSIKAYFP